MLAGCVGRGAIVNFVSGRSAPVLLSQCETWNYHESTLSRSCSCWGLKLLECVFVSLSILNLVLVLFFRRWACLPWPQKIAKNNFRLRRIKWNKIKQNACFPLSLSPARLWISVNIHEARTQRRRCGNNYVSTDYAVGYDYSTIATCTSS